MREGPAERWRLLRSWVMAGGTAGTLYRPGLVCASQKAVSYTTRSISMPEVGVELGANEAGVCEEDGAEVSA